MSNLTQQDYDIFNSIVNTFRKAGYAITVFNPEELNGIPSEDAEERMCMDGWDYIEWHKDEWLEENKE